MGKGLIRPLQDDKIVTFKLNAFVDNKLIRPLQDDKIVTFKLNAFVDNNFKLIQMVQFFFDKVEIIVGKGENTGYQYLFHFPQCLEDSL